MKKRMFAVLTILIFILIFILLLLLRSSNGGEDNYIIDSKGVYIKHGNPSVIPDYVKKQQDALVCAKKIYEEIKQERIVFNSQCLGKCNNYSVDIVHVPRNDEDNKIENQCSDFKNGLTKHFIELDKDGEVVRVV